LTAAVGAIAPNGSALVVSATRPPAAQAAPPHQHDPLHGRRAEAVPAEAGEETEAIRPERPEAEGDRSQQAHPEIEAHDAAMVASHLAW